MRGQQVVFVLFLVFGLLGISPSGRGQEDSEISRQEPLHPQQLTFTLTGTATDGISFGIPEGGKVKVHAFEVPSKDAAGSQAELEKSVDQMTVIQGEDSQEVGSTSNDQKKKSVVKLSGDAFGEWFFKGTHANVTFIVLEFALATSIKYVELINCPMPLNKAVAWFTAMAVGGLLATVDWNSPRLVDFVRTTKPRMSQLINKISQTAKNEKMQERINSQLNVTWSYLKNASVNVALLPILKLIFLVGNTLNTTAISEVPKMFVNHFNQINLVEMSQILAKFAETSLVEGLLMTVFSFPTNLLLGEIRSDKMAEAAGDTEKIRRANISIRYLSGTALTLRLLLAASYTLGAQLESFTMQGISVAGFASLSGVSAWMLKNRKALTIFRCESLLQMR